MYEIEKETEFEILYHLGMAHKPKESRDILGPGKAVKSLFESYVAEAGKA